MNNGFVTIKNHMTPIKPAEQGIIALVLIIVFLCAHSVSCTKKPSVQKVDSAALSLHIKTKVTGWNNPSQAVIGEERIYAAVLVQAFYKGRNYEPGWNQDDNLIQTKTLIRAVEEAYGDGLTPDHYHLGLIRSLADKTEKGASDPKLIADLDIFLTDAFLTLGCHLSAGCVDPVTIQAEWFAKRGKVDVSSVLEQALRKKQVRELLMSLRPEHDSYAKLRQALTQYRELSLKGEWPMVSRGSSLKRNSASDRVVELKRRFVASGDLVSDTVSGSNLFNEQLEQAVIAFQKRHGLKPDGIAGRTTLNALNIPLKQRIRQMELNLERLRWILGNPEQRSIVINIANFELNVIEEGKPVLSMKVIVGKPYMRTPVFTAKMTHLILNPSWNVPDSIAQKEILEKIKRAPHYLAEQDIRVLKGWGVREQEIDPSKINWSGITANTLSYRFRQQPGALNPLGRIKFMFPNQYDVYLHDTPSKRLFSENVRAFSHGCTRIEKPLELAEYVLRDAPGWTRNKLLATIEEGAERKVLIPRPLNVHFLYLTAWVDKEGILQFRNDIYERDKLLDAALRKEPTLH
jgi:murein L,D-transpeptidase YcbB/YkuD